MGNQLPPVKGVQHLSSFRPMSVVATVAHLSNCWALVLCHLWILGFTFIKAHRSTVTDQVAWSVCRSVTVVNPAKMAQPIEMPFGLRSRSHVLYHAASKNVITLLMCTWETRGLFNKFQDSSCILHNNKRIKTTVMLTYFPCSSIQPS